MFYHVRVLLDLRALRVIYFLIKTLENCVNVGMSLRLVIILVWCCGHLQSRGRPALNWMSTSIRLTKAFVSLLQLFTLYRIKIRQLLRRRIGEFRSSEGSGRAGFVHL